MENPETHPAEGQGGDARGLGRRSFLAGIATAGAGAAAASVAPVRAAAETAPAPAPVQSEGTELPGARLVALETGDPATEIDRWHVKNAGSDYMVDCLKHVGYDYITCMPGSTFRGIHESIVNYGGNSKPELLSCMHEEISSAMAYGYAQMAGKPMAILVHSTVGLQHASMGIYNAYAARLPMLVLVGNIADGATRRPGVEWFHTATDVAAIVRGYVKYDAQPASLQSFGEEIMKASSMAMTPPYEPTLVVVDADLAEMPVEGKPLPLPSFVPVRPPVADPAALADVAKLLVNAQNPVIIADRLARTAAGMAALVQLAETLQIPVVDYGNRNNFPTNHHLNASWTRGLAAQADVILGLELTDLFGVVGDVPDLPIRQTTMRIKPTTTVISINSMYLQGAGNYQDQQRFFNPTLPIAGDGEASLPYLIDAVNRAITSERRAQNTARAARWSDAWTQRRQADLAAAAVGWDASPISLPRLCQELYAKIKGDDFSLVSGTFQQGLIPNRLWDLDQYRQYSADYGAYGIGSSLPATVGAALAARDLGRYAVNIQGDGDFLVAPASLWTAAHHKIPLLTIMHNNRAWHQETMHIQRMADRRERNPDRGRIGTVIDDPNVDFGKLAQSFGVYGEGPITQPDQLGPAIARALKVVKNGMPALVDVVTQPR
jgi:thiamine pyrophosphate-dependent acetolactate synthase large subunit-like protein